MNCHTMWTSKDTIGLIVYIIGAVIFTYIFCKPIYDDYRLKKVLNPETMNKIGNVTPR